ncbi:MAG: zinc finger domain-containing protein, partial [Patescibacteria group bacterium]
IGKNIIINLSDNHIILVHQKLSGHLLFGRWKIKDNIPVPVIRGILDDRINKYIHLILYLSGGDMVALSDLRKFAKVISGPKDKIFSLPEISKLGPDPLEKGLTFKKFYDLINNKKGGIKKILLDQEVIAGIGNIYADEILWACGVHPLTKVDDISSKKLEKMYNEMRRILRFSIKLGGDSMSDFRDIYGERGGYQNHHKAYQRDGEPCFFCKTKIERIKIVGRSSHFCPKCQELKRNT